MLPAGAGQRPKRAPAAAPVAPLLPLKAAPTAPSRPGGPLLRRPAARAVLLVLTLLVAHRLVQNAWWQSTAPAGTKQEAAPKQEAGSAPEVPAPQQERPRIRVRPPAELLPPQVAAASGDACAQALGMPKVALLFLTRGDMHHERVWRLWFESAAGLIPAWEAQAAVCKSSASKYRALVKACAGEQASEAASEVVKGQHLFSVYVHAPPLFKGYPEDSLWAPHLIDRRVATVWGGISLVEATRHLMWKAFEDPLNQRFALVSESDLPLYDPLTFYQQLVSEPKSRVNACVHGARTEQRWTDELKTEHLQQGHWRKSGQFLGLTREHVELVLNDEEVYRSFERFCRKPRGHIHCSVFPDEHYFPMLLAVLGKDEETCCNCWGVAGQDWSQGGDHPKSFSSSEVEAGVVKLRETDKCNGVAAYEDAQRGFVEAATALLPDRKQSCKRLQAAAANATYAHEMPGYCALTGRKFPADTADAALDLFRSSCPPAPVADSVAPAPGAGDSASGSSTEGEGAKQQEAQQQPSTSLKLLSRAFCEREAE